MSATTPTRRDCLTPEERKREKQLAAAGDWDNTEWCDIQRVTCARLTAGETERGLAELRGG